ERVKAGLAARAEALRQRTLLDVVGTAVQELRGGRSPGAADQGATSAERILTAGTLQLDTWRQLATLSAHTDADANRIPGAAVPGRARRDDAFLRPAGALHPRLRRQRAGGRRTDQAAHPPPAPEARTRPSRAALYPQRAWQGLPTLANRRIGRHGPAHD